MVSNTTHAGAPTNVINAEQAVITFFGPNSSSQTSQEFTVDQFPFYFSAYNLGADDVVTVQQIVSHGATKLVSTYQPVFGPAVLDTNRSKLVIEHPGRYQLHHTGSSSLGTFTVIGAAASSASTGFAELASALQAVASVTIQVNGVIPIHVTGTGTQSDPYEISTPWISVPETVTSSISIGYNVTGITGSDVLIGSHINASSSAGGNTNNTVIGTAAGWAAISTTKAVTDSIIINGIIGGGNGTFTNNIVLGGTLGNSTPMSNAISIGYHATGFSSASGGVAVGDTAGGEGTVNLSNYTLIGYKAGGNSLAGGNLTAIGFQAGYAATTAVGTYLGAFAGNGATFSNGIVINNPSGTALNTSQANQAVLGDSSITQLVTAGSIIQGGVISASDERLKTNVESEYNALEAVNKLNPVTFNWDLNKIKQFKAVVDTTEQEALQHGLIAQEVELIFPTFVKEIDRGGGSYKVIKYEKLITVLLAAIQELSEELTELKDRLNVK